MKIFLCGDTGRLNRGCEAIVRGTAEVLEKENICLATFAPEQNLSLVKELGVSMIKYDKHPTKIHRIFFGAVRKIFKRSLLGFGRIQRPLFNKMTVKDICLNIGGDTYCYQRPAISLALNKYTHKNKIKNILWCCSIEKDKIEGEIYKDLLKYEYIFARDPITVDNLISSNIPKEKVIKVCDPAFFLKTKEVELPEGFQVGNTVGINISDCVCYGEYKESYENTKKLISWILSETDMSVCLVPHVYSVDDDYYHDLPILKRLYKEFSNSRISLINKEYSCEELKYIISKCRFFVGARTHSTIAAYSSEIPTIVIGYSVKSLGIATDLFGTYENYVLPFRDLKSDEELLNAFKKLMENEREIKVHFNEFLPEYKKQLSSAIDKYILKNNADSKRTICDKDQCTGCSACFNTCPYDAIKMQQDKNGFLYPIVDDKKCVNCNKCFKACPVNKIKDDSDIPVAYAVKNLDEAVRKTSSSGGVFSLLAETVIKKGGVVFAPSYDKEFNVIHTLVDSADSIDKVRGSKYVQSEIGDCYRMVQEKLAAGVWVLFSGTLCQVAGLKSFLGKDYSNLITQDVICHGIASPGAWSKYLSFRKRKAESDKIKKLIFREKATNGDAALRIEFDDDKSYKESYTKDIFIKSYLSNMNLRPSCSFCSFKQTHRLSDITLGDFWGVENVCPEINDKKGISLVLLHSQKGKEIFESISSNVEFKWVDFTKAISGNKAYLYSSPTNAFSTKFLSKLTDKNFDRRAKKYIGGHFLAKIRRTLKVIF